MMMIVVDVSGICREGGDDDGAVVVIGDGVDNDGCGCGDGGGYGYLEEFLFPYLCVKL